MGFAWERGSSAALPRQPPFASELLQMVLACNGCGSTGRNRLMRYIAIVALAFAFAGSAHGASNDLNAAGKGGEEDTARKAAEGTAQQIAKPDRLRLSPQ